VFAVQVDKAGCAREVKIESAHNVNVYG
jgi:hypothetical protein